MGLVTPWHVGSSQTRDRTRVPCIDRQILNHCTSREVIFSLSFTSVFRSTKLFFKFYKEQFIYLLLGTFYVRLSPCTGCRRLENGNHIPLEYVPLLSALQFAAPLVQPHLVITYTALVPVFPSGKQTKGNQTNKNRELLTALCGILGEKQG